MGQSLLDWHSGRQFGGLPMKFVAQEQVAWLLCSLHKLLGPQGDGEHGFTRGEGVTGSSLQIVNGSP